MHSSMVHTRFPTAHHFTISLFGCQYHAESPSVDKLRLINTFEGLIKPAAIYVEELEQNDLPSKVWMSYWTSPQSFKAWWESSDTSAFWNSLPDNAGFWRETVSLPATRAMYQCNKDNPTGFARCGELIPLTKKTGYWGAYRARLTSEAPDDKFQSPLSAVPEPKPLSDEIRPGRIRITKFPDNICFNVEGQDYSSMPERERAHWNGTFDGPTKEWVTSAVTGGPPKGMLSARACHGFAGPKRLGATNSPSLFPNLDYVRQVQLLFWLDLSKMEHMGRTDKNHVKIRREFLTSYGPGGIMEGGEVVIWVDMGILKGEEMDAEYVGCYDGTGFLAYDGYEAFVSEQGVGSKLPSFFDEPVESKPLEW